MCGVTHPKIRAFNVEREPGSRISTRTMYVHTRTIHNVAPKRPTAVPGTNQGNLNLNLEVVKVSILAEIRLPAYCARVAISAKICFLVGDRYLWARQGPILEQGGGQSQGVKPQCPAYYSAGTSIFDSHRVSATCFSSRNELFLSKYATKGANVLRWASDATGIVHKPELGTILPCALHYNPVLCYPELCALSSALCPMSSALCALQLRAARFRKWAGRHVAVRLE